jgi:hypothetical protein
MVTIGTDLTAVRHALIFDYLNYVARRVAPAAQVYPTG